MKDIKKNISQFLFHCEYEKNLSKKTIKAYKIDLKQFLKYLHSHFGKEPEIDQITKETIRFFIAYLVKKYAIKSAKRKIATTKAFFNYLEFDDKITINPFRKVRIRLKEPFRLPVVLDMAEVKSIFRIAYKERAGIKNKASYRYCSVIRDIAILELLFATGIRVGELCSLKTQNVDLINGYIKVQGKGNKERVIQLCNNELLAALAEYKCISDSATPAHFFHNRLNRPLSSQSVRFMIRKYATRTKTKKKVTPHSFRHTFATMLLEEGVDIKYIQKILGHSSILTTQIYTHVSNQKQKEILALKHPRNRLRFG